MKHILTLLLLTLLTTTLHAEAEQAEHTATITLQFIGGPHILPNQVFSTTLSLLPLSSSSSKPSLPYIEVADAACAAYSSFRSTSPSSSILRPCSPSTLRLFLANGTLTTPPIITLPSLSSALFLGLEDDQWMWTSPPSASAFPVSLPPVSWFSPTPPLPFPLHLQQVSLWPRVFGVRSLLSVQETWYLRTLGKRSGLGQSRLVDGSVEPARRSSSTASLAQAELQGDPFLPILRARVQSLLRLDDPVGYASVEAFQVVRYQPGQHFGLHYDPLVSDHAINQTDPVTAQSCQRFATLFVYLGQDDPEKYGPTSPPPKDTPPLSPAAPGSPTVFPASVASPDELDPSADSAYIPGMPLGEDEDADACEWMTRQNVTGLALEPDQGDALLFYSFLPPGQEDCILDTRAVHGGCKVPQDAPAKWGLNIWFASRVLRDPNGNPIYTPGREPSSTSSNHDHDHDHDDYDEDDDHYNDDEYEYSDDEYQDEL